jgi:hypothetical protein
MDGPGADEKEGKHGSKDADVECPGVRYKLPRIMICWEPDLIIYMSVFALLISNLASSIAKADQSRTGHLFYEATPGTS